MDDKVVFEEAGRAHRYFLNWRHAIVAGYFAILYAVVSLSIQLKDDPKFLGVLLICSSPIGVALWIADWRNRQLYYAAVQAARAIEAGEKGGLYARIDESSIKAKEAKDHQPGWHTRAIKYMFWGYSIVLLMLGLWNLLTVWC